MWHCCGSSQSNATLLCTDELPLCVVAVGRCRWLVARVVEGLGDFAKVLVHRSEEKHAGRDEYDDDKKPGKSCAKSARCENRHCDTSSRTPANRSFSGSGDSTRLRAS